MKTRLLPSKLILESLKDGDVSVKLSLFLSQTGEGTSTFEMRHTSRVGLSNLVMLGLVAAAITASASERTIECNHCIVGLIWLTVANALTCSIL